MEMSVISSLVVGAFVGPAAGYLGSIMVSRRMSLVGDALSHVALPGLALGILFNFNPFIGAFAFLSVVMLATWYLQRSTTLPVDAIIGVLFVLALAIGILITPETELLHALFGDISSVTPVDALITAVIATGTAYATRLIYRRMTLSMISKDLAISVGVKVDTINLVYLLLVAVIVAIGIKEVGTLLVGAVVIVPAAAANYISSSLRQYGVLSAIFGGISALTGITAAAYTGYPSGPLVVIAGVLIFVISFGARSFQKIYRRSSE